MLKHLHLFKTLFLLLAIVAGGNVVTASGATGTKVSSLSGIEDGATYYIAALNSDKYYTVPNTTISGQTFTCAEGSFSDPVLTPAAGAGEFVFTAVADKENAYYIYNTNLKKYLVATGSKKFGYVESSSTDYGYWTFSNVTSGGFSGVFSVTHSSKTHYMRAYNNSVRCYDGASNKGVYLFKKSDPCATPTFSETSGTELAKGTEVIITSATTGSTIYYTTNGDTPTTSSDHGTAGDASATVTVNDNVTIKAIAVKDGNENSDVATATYTVAKNDNAITVTGGETLNIALTGASAIDMFDLDELVSATYGTPTYTITSTTNLVEGTDFDFADGLFEFKKTFKGIIVVTASVAETSDYKGAEQDITINCSGDLRTPFYLFNNPETIYMGGTLTVNTDNVESDGEITLSTSDDAVATVNNTTKTVTPVATGTCNITVTTAAGKYYSASSTTFALNVLAAKGSAENPYTVAEARAAIDADEGVTDVCVKGIVCTAGSSYYSSSKLNYWISDDGSSTNRLQIYRGTGMNGTDFTGTSDIQVGDVVIVKGDLTLYGSSTYEFSEGSQLVYFKRKSASDLTITTSSPVALEITTALPHPTSTITWTTSSVGDVICVSSDDDVVTVTDAGVITAQGVGTATITITQDADEDYKEGEQVVTVNVTDNRSVAATAIDLPVAQKTLTKGDTDNFSATSTKADGFTGNLTYTYVSNNTSVLEIADNTFSAEGVGTATVTITATPTGGNADNYKSASQEVEVVVNGTNSISLDKTSNVIAFSAGTFDIEATVPTENYDGTVSAVSSNESVATVSVDGTTVKVTPVAVGTATITVTAGTGTYYLTTAQAECTVEFTQPAGGTTALSGSVTLFHETFGSTSSARAWNDSYSVKSGVSSVYSGVSYTVTSANQSKTGNGSTGSGLWQNTTGTDASIIIGPLNVAAYKDMTLTYKWKAGSIKGTYSTTASYATSSTGEYTELTGTGAGATTFVDRTYSLPAAAQVSTLYLKIVFNTSNTNAVIDEIDLSSEVSLPDVTLNSNGYATICSEYPLDFTDYETADYSAWQVTAANEGKMTFSQVTGTVKGGTGLLLKGDANATVTLKSSGSSNTLDDNMFEGTLVPTYIADNEYLGLSGKTFVPVKAGTVKAGKALLPVSAIGSSVRELTFEFEDNQTTGIESLTPTLSEGEGAVYDMQGRKVVAPQKGLYIVNGKKVVIK